MEQSDIVALLRSYGFTDLQLLTFDPLTNTSNYKYGESDTRKLKSLGEATVTSNGKVAVYRLSDVGKLGYCPSKSLVRFIFKGKARPNKLSFDSAGHRIPTPPELEQAFYKAQASPAYQKAFVKKVWLWANQHFFSSKMRLPIIYVGTVYPPNPKLSNATGVMSVSPYGKPPQLYVNSKGFNATEQIIVGTIVHEMCHQATHEIDKETAAESVVDAGHGPGWQKWMRHCNLVPNRHDFEDQLDYGDSTGRLLKKIAQNKLLGPKVTPDSFRGLKQVDPRKLTSADVVLFDHDGYLVRAYLPAQTPVMTFQVLNPKGFVTTYLDVRDPSAHKFYLAPIQKKALE